MALVTQRYTFDQWVESPLNAERSELVDGIPVERMTTGGWHGAVVKRLERWLDQAEMSGHGQRFSGPTGVLLDSDGARANLREPDVYFVHRDRPLLLTSKGIEGTPDLVIEVLSPGNRMEDMPGGDVWLSYERFGVPSYWIVDLATHTVLQYRRELGHFMHTATLRPGETLRSDLFPGSDLPSEDLFAGMPWGHSGDASSPPDFTPGPRTT